MDLHIQVIQASAIKGAYLNGNSRSRTAQKGDQNDMKLRHLKVNFKSSSTPEAHLEIDPSLDCRWTVATSSVNIFAG